MSLGLYLITSKPISGYRLDSIKTDLSTFDSEYTYIQCQLSSAVQTVIRLIMSCNYRDLYRDLCCDILTSYDATKPLSMCIT